MRSKPATDWNREPWRSVPNKTHWRVVRERFQQNLREIAAGDRPTFQQAPGADTRQQIYEKIKALKLTLGLNTVQFADKLRIDRHFVARWERGEDTPKPEHLRRLQELGLEL